MLKDHDFKGDPTIMSSDMSETVIRHAVTEDAGALLQLYSQPDTMADTLQLPTPRYKSGNIVSARYQRERICWLPA